MAEYTVTITATTLLKIAVSVGTQQIPDEEFALTTMFLLRLQTAPSLRTQPMTEVAYLASTTPAQYLSTVSFGPMLQWMVTK